MENRKSKRPIKGNSSKTQVELNSYSFPADALLPLQDLAETFSVQALPIELELTSSSTVGTISAFDGTVTGTLSIDDADAPTLPGSFSDDYQLVDLTVGQFFTLTLVSEDFDTYLQLINADTGEVITFDDDSGTEYNSQLSFTPEAGTNYRVRVTSYETASTGNYTLSAKRGAPDLVVTDLVAPTSAYLGNRISVSWTVTNRGSLATPGDWYDAIYLSSDPFFDKDTDIYVTEEWIASETLLEVGDSYRITRHLTVPRIATGARYLLLVVDEGNERGETDSTNNVRTVPLYLADGVDLEVIHASAPDSVIAGQSISVSWTTTNRGGVTANSNWFDSVYLSEDTTLDPTDIYITAYQWAGHQTPLPGGNWQYTFNKNLVVPSWATEGSQYLLFVADGERNQNETDETNNVLARPIQVKAPDLVVSAASAPATVILGQKIGISWTVTNQSDVTAISGSSSTRRYDVIYVSDDTILDPTDTLVYSDENALTVAARQSYARNRDIVIPTTAVGNRYLLFVTDRGNNQGETDDTNNVLAVPLQIVDGPDLVVSNATAPSVAFVGEAIAVTWTVTNRGNVIAKAPWGGWEDAVYFSTDPIFDENTDIYLDELWIDEPLVPLTAGSSYTLRSKVQLPNWLGISSGYLLFVADPWDDQGEIDNTNNTRAVPFEIVKAPDLDISSATAPSVANLGDTLSVSWTVTNLGDVAALAPYQYDKWDDAIYLSDDTTFDPETDTYLVSEYIREQTPLMPGASYTIERHLVIPNTARVGNQYLLLVTDRYEDQGETDETNNVLARPLKILGSTPAKADLVVSDVTTPRETVLGQTVPVSWTVTNQGNADILSLYLYDFIYISDDTTLDADDTFVSNTQIGNQFSLAAGASYTISRDLVVPVTATGNRYLLLVTDKYNHQLEADETNNVRAVPLELKALDLTVSSLQAPSAADSGQTVDVSWTVTNLSSVTAPSAWADQFYLSDDATLDAVDLWVSSVSTASEIPLGAGGSYTFNRQLVIPTSARGGRQYLLLVTDAYNTQGETDETNNVKAVPLTVNVPDLVVSATAPPMVNLGDTMAVSWTVTNLGSVASPVNWSDYIYLSNDPILDATDLAVGSQSIGNQAPLAAGGSYTLNRHLVLPNMATSGSQYLLFVADGANFQGETDETNNVSAVPIQLGAPDLEVSWANAPTEAILSQTIPISWTVTNRGAVTATADWYDRIYISDDLALDWNDTFVTSKAINSQTPLIASSSYTITQNIFIPYTAIGSRYL